jgi:hypothetical protein
VAASLEFGGQLADDLGVDIDALGQFGVGSS